MNCLYKSQNKYSMSGDPTRAHQLHTWPGTHSNLTIHFPFSLPLSASACFCYLPGPFPTQRCSLCYRVPCICSTYELIGHVNMCLLSLFCSALSEAGHVVSGWWWWWLSNVRMSPESGNCDWFLFLNDAQPEASLRVPHRCFYRCPFVPIICPFQVCFYLGKNQMQHSKLPVSASAL